MDEEAVVNAEEQLGATRVGQWANVGEMIGWERKGEGMCWEKSRSSRHASAGVQEEIVVGDGIES